MIKIYNRKTKAYDVEQVAGLKYINWSYASPIGKSFLELFIKKKMFSKLYGNFCDSPLSKKKIKAFIDIYLYKTIIIHITACMGTSICSFFELSWTKSFI